MAQFALSAYRQTQFSISPGKESRGRAYAVEATFVPAKTRIDLGLRCVSFSTFARTTASIRIASMRVIHQVFLS
jgi:hypothetical protein